MQAPDEPLILSLDTATDVRSVVLVRGGVLQAHAAAPLRAHQAASLLGDIDAVLHAAGVPLDAVDLFAVARGPGSFTGLRAGLATVKAFATSLDKPVLGVPTLHAVAAATGPAARVVATLPAGRGEVFAQLLAVAADGTCVELTAPAHLPPATLVERARDWGAPLVWAGSGARAHVAVLRAAAAAADIDLFDSAEMDSAGEPSDDAAARARVWVLARPLAHYAGAVAALAAHAYRAGRAEPAEALTALYVRLSDAELNERCRV